MTKREWWVVYYLTEAVVNAMLRVEKAATHSCNKAWQEIQDMSKDTK